MSYDVFSRFYDSLTDNVEYEKRAEYFCLLLSMCRKEKGILLDLGCGTGGISIEAAKKGYDVIGVDISVGMLNEARRKAAESGVSLLLLNQSMDELDLYGTVDFALCVLDGINHLDDAEMVKRTFERVSLFMVPGGAFAFDVNTPYKHKNVLADNAFVYDLDSLYCVWQNSYNESDGSVDITLDFFEEEDGAYYRSSEYITERSYPLEDISRWLEQAGFEVMGVFDDMTLDHVRPGSEKAVFLAKKK